MVYDIEFFSQTLSEYGDGGHLVGYPAEGVGHFVDSNFSFLAVNAESEHKEEIRDYIALLLDYDRQMYRDWGMGVSIRRDVVRDSVVIEDGVPKRIITINGNTLLSEVNCLKPDGSSYQEEFMELLESAVARDKWPAQIREILTEEMEPYVQGDKTAREAARLIQNRVQLYLDEQ